MSEINVYERIQTYIQENKNDSELKGKTESEVVSIMLARGVLSEAEYKTYKQASIFLSQTHYWDNIDVFQRNNKPQTDIGIYENYALNRLNQNIGEAKEIVEERDKEGGPFSKIVNAGHEYDAIIEKGDLEGKIIKVAFPGPTALVALLFNSENAKSTIENNILESQKDFEYLQKIAQGEEVRSDYVRTNPITFAEAWKERRGVEFDENALRTCEEKSQVMAQINLTVNTLNSVKSQLRKAGSVGLNQNTRPDVVGATLLQAFKLAGITNIPDINKVISDIESEYKDHPNIKKYGGDLKIEKDTNGKWVLKCTTPAGNRTHATAPQISLITEELCKRLNVTIAEGLGLEFDETITSQELEEKISQKVSEVKTDYEASFAEAYGEKDLKLLAQRYVEKQEQGVANIQMALNVASMAIMLTPGVLGAGGWLLKGTSAATKIAQAAATAQKVGQVLSPLAMINMTLSPVELLEQMTSENGMSEEEWKLWGQGVLESSTYMAVGMGVGKIAEVGAAMYKMRALVTTLKEAGKNADEIMALIKANPVKFPPEIVQSLKTTDTIAKTFQVGTEFALDIGTTVALNKAMGHEGFQVMDVASSIMFAISGTVFQKQFMSLSTESKRMFLQNALKDFDITRSDAERILKAMDDISAGKVVVPNDATGHKLATSKKELLKQIERDCPEFASKFYLIESAMRNSKLAVSDVSEILSLMSVNKSLEGFFNNNFLAKIEDVNLFKENLKTVVEFKQTLSQETHSDLIEKLSNLKSSFLENLDKIDVETFKKNLELFATFDADMRYFTTKYDNSVLFTVHDEKAIQRIEFVRDFNKIAEENSSNIKIKMGLKSWIEMTDEQFEIARKNHELVQSIKSIFPETASLIMSYAKFDITGYYSDFVSKIPEEKINKRTLHEYLRLIVCEQSDSAKNFLEAVKNLTILPDKISEQVVSAYSELFNFEVLDFAKQQEVISKLNILSKIPQFMMVEGGYYSIDKFKKFVNIDYKNIEKIDEFISLADETTLKRIGNIYPPLAEFTGGVDIDLLIANAKAQKDLPEGLREYMHERIKGLDYYQKDIQTLNSRIEKIRQYETKLPEFILAKIYEGTVIKEDVLEMFTACDKEVLKKIESRFNEVVSAFDSLSKEDLEKMTYVANLPKASEYYDFAIYLSSEWFVSLIKNLDWSELEMPPADFFFTSRVLKNAEDLKQRISAIPEKLESYLKRQDSSLYIVALDPCFSGVAERHEFFNNLPEEVIDALGSKVIVDCYTSRHEFLPERCYEWKNVPQEIRDIYGVNACRLLCSTEPINIEKMVERLDYCKSLSYYSEIAKSNELVYVLGCNDLQFELIKSVYGATDYPNIETRNMVIGTILNDINIDINYEFIKDFIAKNPSDKKCLAHQLSYIIDARSEEDLDFRKNVVRYLLDNCKEFSIDANSVNGILYNMSNQEGINANKVFDFIKKLLKDHSLENVNIITKNLTITGKFIEAHTGLINNLLTSRVSVEDVNSINFSICCSSDKDAIFNFIDSVVIDEKIDPQRFKSFVENIFSGKLNVAKKLYNSTECSGVVLKNIDALNNKYVEDIIDKAIQCDKLEKIKFFIERFKDASCVDKFIKLQSLLPDDKINALPESTLAVAVEFVDLCNVNNINELSIAAKKETLRSLVASNADLFSVSAEIKDTYPLIPTDQKGYCALLPQIVRSMGLESKAISEKQRLNFEKSLNTLSEELANISDDDFTRLKISQEYHKDAFIKNVLALVRGLSVNERQKIYDYFGFELHSNKANSTGFSIKGYPMNLNNGEKLSQIIDAKTRDIVEKLRPEVIRFSEKNPIKCNNPQLEKLLNEVIVVLPELRIQIGKAQHKTHSFDILKHSLKVMQKISQDPKFKELNESDQKIMMLASLLHDITKAEGFADKTHAGEGSFDTFFISKKFNLTREEEIKLYTLVKHHEWLEYANTAKSEKELIKRLQSIAFDLQNGNLFEMSLIFTHADLRAVKSDDSFHDTNKGPSRVSFDGSVRSYGESADVYAKRIQNYVQELQKSQPLLPVTKFPAASKIAEAITDVRPDGSTNIKGVYKDKDGLIVIKYNEVEDWEVIGFPKGSVSRGIEAQKGVNYGDAGLKDDVDTGNIKFFAHGLDYENQLVKFDAFGLADSDVLLSISYAERPESKYRFFRAQGVLLDFDTKYIHGGGNSDSGSGYGKFVEEFKKNYIFGGCRTSDRLYVSNLIKNATGMNDEEYIKFVKENENKSFTEIEPVGVREKIIKAFASINSNERKGSRSYNEMYGSNPKKIMGVFAYSTNTQENYGNPISFLNRGNADVEDYKAGVSSVYDRTEFLRRYALEHDVPFVVFGD